MLLVDVVQKPKLWDFLVLLFLEELEKWFFFVFVWLAYIQSEEKFPISKFG